MKSIFKILVLGVVPILAVTAVMDLGLAADKGSQLIFQSNMAHQNYISISNTSSKAVTVLTQYYNDEMKPVLFYLRVITGGGTVLVDPFDHMIPGTDPPVNVSDEIDTLPAMTNDDDGPGINSGHFVIAVTAVGANIAVDENADKDDKDVTAATVAATAAANAATTVNVLFPSFLAADLHGTDNIDNCGMLQNQIAADSDEDTQAMLRKQNNNLALTKTVDADDNCDSDDDHTSKNVGDLSVDNAEPIAFNYLSGHYTSALEGTASGGSDQTASWGGIPVTRPAVDMAPAPAHVVPDPPTDNEATGYNESQARDAVMQTPIGTAYMTLNGMNTDATSGGGRLADKNAGGMAGQTWYTVEGYTNEGGNRMGEDGKIIDRTPAHDDTTGAITAGKRVVNGGLLSLPALYAGDESQLHHVVQFLSVADDFGDQARGEGGDYKLITAKTKYMVSLQDGMGDMLPDPSDERKFGGAGGSDLANTRIIVDGIAVEINAKACEGTSIMGAWSLSDLTSIVPTANSGASSFAGLEAMLDDMSTVSPGLISFKREAFSCKFNNGDGTPATSGAGGTEDEPDGDGVPAVDERVYTGGTLVIEEEDTQRSFVTTGTLVVKYLTPMSTFAASWPLTVK